MQWESAKFSTKLPIRQITDDISKVRTYCDIHTYQLLLQRVSAIEGEMKLKIAAYSKVALPLVLAAKPQPLAGQGKHSSAGAQGCVCCHWRHGV